MIVISFWAFICFWSGVRVVTSLTPWRFDPCVTFALHPQQMPVVYHKLPALQVDFIADVSEILAVFGEDTLK
jgi:hypothetical protein